MTVKEIFDDVEALVPFVLPIIIPALGFAIIIRFAAYIVDLFARMTASDRANDDDYQAAGVIPTEYSYIGWDDDEPIEPEPEPAQCIWCEGAFP